MYMCRCVGKDIRKITSLILYRSITTQGFWYIHTAGDSIQEICYYTYDPIKLVKWKTVENKLVNGRLWWKRKLISWIITGCMPVSKSLSSYQTRNKFPLSSLEGSLCDIYRVEITSVRKCSWSYISTSRFSKHTQEWTWLVWLPKFWLDKSNKGYKQIRIV